MTIQSLENSATTFRNFNLCPHCQLHGEQALLGRMCEGLPMISRSDGNLFHLLLADQPLPYPNERSSGPTYKLSVCFWYSHVSRPHTTNSTIVILRAAHLQRATVFRIIECVADLLAEELVRRSRLASLYELRGDSLAELPS